MQEATERQRAAVCRQAVEPAVSGAFFVLSRFILPSVAPPALDRLVAADPGCPPMTDAELQPLIEEAARSAELNPEWLRTIIQQTSQGRPCALSPTGGAGLMALPPGAIEQPAAADPYDPRQNLAAGARLLKQLVDQNGGDSGRALAAYPGTSPSPEPAPAIQNSDAPADKNQ